MTTKIFLKATTTDNKTEYFNLDNVLNIAARDNGTIKILMGAGLYWNVYADSMEYVDLLQEFKGER